MSQLFLGKDTVKFLAPKIRLDPIYARFGNNNGVLNIPSIALFDGDGKMLQRRFPESEDAPALLKAIESTLHHSAD